MKLRACGRGRGYSVWRGLLESFLGAVYRGDWPARLWDAVPGSREVVVTRHTLTLPAGAGGRLRVAFVSDIHVGPTTPLSLLERTFEVIRGERPDVLLLGGDYVYLDAEPRRMAVLGSLVRSVAAAALDGRPFRIVLCHSPDGLGLLSGIRFDVFLAGHTHGGQIAAPWGPIVLPHGRMCRVYPSGLAQFESGAVYVSRGIGTVELPIRTFSPPDILLLELVRPGGQEEGVGGRDAP